MKRLLLVLVALVGLAGPAGAVCPGWMTLSGSVCNSLADYALNTGSDGLTMWRNIKGEGAIADGSSHALSTVTTFLGQNSTSWTAAQWETALGMPTGALGGSTSHELDWAVAQSAAWKAFGAPGSEHSSSNPIANQVLYFPHGRYKFGTETLKLTKVQGCRIIGDGPIATDLRSNGIVFQTDGFQYCIIDGMSFVREAIDTSAATPAVDIDGNASGTTLAVQFVTLNNVAVDGGGNNYALAFCRVGSSGAQCSNIVINNSSVHHTGFGYTACTGLPDNAACSAALYVIGGNEVSFSINNGDFQDYTVSGIYLAGSQIGVRDTSFEAFSQGSRPAYQYIANGGCDIWEGDGGALASTIISGVRTEGLCLLHSTGLNPTVIEGIASAAAIPNQYKTPGGYLAANCTTSAPNRVWAASTHYNLNDALIECKSGNVGTLYVVTTAGTSGTSEPLSGGYWPAGTVNDNAGGGTVVWKEAATLTSPYWYIYNPVGTINTVASWIEPGVDQIYNPLTPNCSGSPTSGFKSKYGIVTAC